MITQYIDYIDDPEDTFEEYLEKAKKYNFRCVFVDVARYEEAVAFLEGKDVIVAGAVDFPEGKLPLEEKMAEFSRYAEKGFAEIDYTLNQQAIECRDFSAIELEMKTIADFCRKNDLRDKAIVEMCKLDGDLAAKEEICQIANRAKPAFLKTSTGRSFGGAKLEDVKLMRQILDADICIKAAGGIHNYEEAKAFIDAGADALGASAGVAIAEGEPDQ